ncbi:MAG TPA: SDR family oxidoreductase [Puia sp.]|nr:SDR family oxidoreductase [Puia sp.]
MNTVLILGASSDMAVAIAKKLAGEGNNIQLAARNVERLKPLQSDLSIRYSITCTLHEFDAEQSDQHAAFFGGLTPAPDVTICVFGYLGEQTRAEADWKECERTIQVNYTGAVSILNAAASHYQAQKAGLIVGISSVAGERGRLSNYIYGSAKAGFTAYLAGMRNRLFHHGVHVLTVKPGFVYTRMTEALTLPKPLTATPEQVANAIARAMKNKKNTIYVKWFWRWIMLIIKSIPEPIFKKLKM